MMTANTGSLRPPASRSRSPSPAPGDRAQHARASMGPSARPTGFQGTPLSPRPGGARPTSELLGNSVNFQTPEAEAIDQWFENLQNYEATLEEMAAASMDLNFKEELSAIEQWFKVLSEAERTAALYSLLQHSTQVQIRFFITVLQQMARSDPMTALLSPAVGGSMQAQMEAKLAQMSLKSPGIKSPLPGSPVARSFSGAQNRQSMLVESTSASFLSPDSAGLAGPQNDAAGVLAQQRAKLKANAAHRISAPALSTMGGDGRNVWGAVGATPLDQVSERAPSPAQELVVPSGGAGAARPKSTDFSGAANAFRSGRPGAEDAPMSPTGDSWASMVNTPLIPMFQKDARGNVGGGGGAQALDAAAQKLSEWSGGARVPMLDDPKKFRRVSKGNTGEQDGGMQQHQQQQQQQNGGMQGAAARNTSGTWRNGPPNGGQNGGQYPNGGQNGGQYPNGGQNGGQYPNGLGVNNGPFVGGNNGGWNGAKSPALSNTSSNRYNGSDDGSMSGLGVGGYNMGNMNMPSPGLAAMGMQNLAAAGMAGQLNPFMLANMNMNAMGISPEAQLLAAQMAASGFGVGQMNSPFGLAGLQAQQLAGAMGGGGRGGPGLGMGGAGGGARAGGRSPSGGKTASAAGSAAAKKNEEEDVDPKVLDDIPAWLRSLRLHKYTPNFEGMHWRDMCMMDEAALEAKGVAALGARRKMLKTFEVVRKKMGIEEPAGAVPIGDDD